VQPHGADGEPSEVDETCPHTGVCAGDPWVLNERKGKQGGIVCRLCGVWWPGHDLTVPLRTHRVVLEDEDRPERTDESRTARGPQLPPKPRQRRAASWSNTA
jgi:hypothetical protein